MQTIPSIRQGLSRLVIQVSLAWSVAVFGVVWLAVHSEIDKVLDGALQESAEILYGLLNANAGTLPPGAHGALPAPPHDEHLVWQIVAPDQRVLWRSHRAPAVALAPAGRVGLSSTDPIWRVYGIPFDAGGDVLYVAQPHAERSRARLLASTVTASGALLVGLACAFWLRRRVTRELTPVLDLSRQVATYHPLDAGALTPTATRAELVPVRDAIVHLGQRLAGLVAGERAFSAHAAHALRTPLAGLGAQLALALRESPPAVQPRIRRAREAADRLSRVVTALLSLFRSGSEPQPQTIELVPFVRDLPLDGLAIEVHGAGQVFADPDLLAAALLNLLDNSLRYGARQARFSFASEARHTVIRLEDDGPGVDAATRQRLSRALASQQYEQDMGLGLMLADRITRAHGGGLTLLALDQGFGIELRFANPRP